ncbi:MAG: hypothetical protein KDC90_00310 [Ignavibacteriae bacterium]|nr:hypothetical protein [Ignavibacteriota bacterium]
MENNQVKKKIANTIIYYFKLLVVSVILTLLGILVAYLLEDTKYDTGWGFFLDDVPFLILMAFGGILLLDFIIKIVKWVLKYK